MRKILATLGAILLTVSLVSAKIIPDTPVESKYWRQFSAVFVVQNKVLAVGHRGIATFRFNATQTQLKEIGHERHNMIPVHTKLLGDQIWVADTGGLLHVFDVDSSQVVSYKHSSMLPTDFVDFTRYHDDIIVSRGFQGLWRYRLADGAEPQFIDSTFRGVLTSSVMTDGDILYAYDQYNGVMRYELQGDTFGAFQAYLYSEYEGTTCTKYQNKFFLTGINSGIIEGEFGHAGSGVVKVVKTRGVQSRVTVTDERFIVQDERSIEWIDRTNALNWGGWLVDDGSYSGDVFYPVNGDIWFIYPSRDGGIVRYSIRNNEDPTELLDRPGPITGLAFSKGRLVTGGRRSPIDILDLDSTGRSHYAFSVTESHPATSGLITTADTIIAIYPEAERLGLVEVDFVNRKSVVIASSMIDTIGIVDLKYVRGVRGNHDVAIIQYADAQSGADRLDVFEVQDSSGLSSVSSWSSNGRILAYEVFDSFAVFATNKNAIFTHIIDSNLTIGSWIPNTLQGGSITSLEYNAPYLNVFRPGRIEVFDFQNPSAALMTGSVVSPLDIIDYTRFDKYLFTVGMGGVQIFNSSDRIPVLLETGGWDGKLLAVDSNHLVVSDGRAIDFYLLSLFSPGTPPDDTGSPPPPPPGLPTTFAVSQNYPNPFNGTTYIEYELPQRADVSIEVFNVLGQRVRNLVAATKEAGRYRAMWDGSNDSHAEVASGIYYYRFSAGKSAIVRKMLYLK